MAISDGAVMGNRFEKIVYLLRHASGAEDFYVQQEDIMTVFPVMRETVGFEQYNAAHQYDLWNHSICTIMNLPRDNFDDMLYVAALLHDVGKLRCQIKRENDPNMHYYGHPVISKKIVEEELFPYWRENAIVLTDDERQRLLYYVEYHDDRVSLRIKHLRRHLQMVPLPVFKNLMLLEVADAKAHNDLPIIRERIDICSTWSGVYADEKYQEILDGK